MGDKRADLFLDPADDPRETGPLLGDERATLLDYLRYQRLTLEVKCSGLDAEQLARRSVEPSTLSLLGLVRHMAEVERGWFRRTLAGEAAPPIYRTADDPDAEFNDAVADPALVEDAWRTLHEEQTFADRFVDATDDLGLAVSHRDGQVSLREILVHMIEEYARHNGHADLLRERIDGRIGQ
jgi:uncharacterized damage-inducible protein DinB